MSSIKYLPEEIVIDILLRLPSKSLIRIRRVCKSWRDLIGSSSFVRSHLNRNVARREDRYLYAYHHSTKDEQGQHSLFSTETFEPCLNLRHPLWTEEQFRIFGSSNGLLCITDNHTGPNSRICIWNPSIQKYRILPKIETQLSEIYIPTRSTSLSFGFHPELNDYMVVRIVQSYTDSSEVAVDIYTLSTNTWKRIRVIPSVLKSINIYLGSAFTNGIVHWTIKTISRDNKVLAFDTGSLEFQELMVPNEDDLELLLVQVCGESLCFFHYKSSNWTIELWMMNKQYSLNKVDTALPWKRACYVPLGSSIKNDELLIAHRCTNERRELCDQMATYNLQSKQFIRTGIRLKDLKPASVYSFAGGEAGDYIESLVRLSD